LLGSVKGFLAVVDQISINPASQAAVECWLIQHTTSILTLIAGAAAEETVVGKMTEGCWLDTPYWLPKLPLPSREAILRKRITQCRSCATRGALVKVERVAVVRLDNGVL
jgi:hypothetical protein